MPAESRRNSKAFHSFLPFVSFRFLLRNSFPMLLIQSDLQNLRISQTVRCGFSFFHGQPRAARGKSFCSISPINQPPSVIRRRAFALARVAARAPPSPLCLG